MVIARCLAGLFLLASPSVGRTADSDERTVIVAVDQLALQADNAQLRVDVLRSQIRAAMPPTNGIKVITDETGVSVYVADLAKYAQPIAQVRQYVSDEPKLVVDEHPALTFRIAYSPAAIKNIGDLDSIQRTRNPDTMPHDKASMPMDAQALGNFIGLLREPLAGVQIESQPDGAIVRSDDPTFDSALTDAVRSRFHGFYVVARLTNDAWRVSIDPKAIEFLAPGRRLRTGAMTAEVLRTELRDPLDLSIEINREGVEATVNDPDRHRGFDDNLKKVFAENADFILTSEPSQLLRVRGKAREGATSTAPGENGAMWPLFQAANALRDIADPPIEILTNGRGVVVRAKDPIRAFDRIANVRRALASRSDLVVVPQSDQSTKINFATEVPVNTRVEQARLERAVQARLVVLKIAAFSLKAVAPDRVVVSFENQGDAAAFRKSIVAGFGFSIRMVDDDIAPGSRDVPQLPGEARLPQSEGGYLWLRRGAVIRGDMIADAKAGTDGVMKEPDIDFSLTEDGRARFAAATAANIGRRFAIVLDGVILSAPTVQSEIAGGRVQIISNFTIESSRALAESMRAYKDDLPLKVVDQKTGT